MDFVQRMFIVYLFQPLHINFFLEICKRDEVRRMLAFQLQRLGAIRLELLLWKPKRSVFHQGCAN